MDVKHKKVVGTPKYRVVRTICCLDRKEKKKGILCLEYSFPRGISVADLTLSSLEHNPWESL